MKQLKWVIEKNKEDRLIFIPWAYEMHLTYHTYLKCFSVSQVMCKCSSSASFNTYSSHLSYILYYFHFIDGETEAKSDQLPLANKWRKHSLDSGTPTPSSLHPLDMATLSFCGCALAVPLRGLVRVFAYTRGPFRILKSKRVKRKGYCGSSPILKPDPPAVGVRPFPFPTAASGLC